MSHAGKLVIMMLIMVLAAGVVFAQSAPAPKPAWPAYLFSIFLGFGTGQFWVGGNGNLFLIGDLSCVGVMAAGAVTVLSSSPSSTSGLSGVSVGYLMIGVSAVALSVFRIWELIDVFGAVEAARKEGKVAEMEPVLSVSPTSLEMGVRLPL
jgi:hypothetical protein